MRVRLASLTLSNLPGVIDYFKDHGYLEIMMQVARNKQPRNDWLLENCINFEVESVADPFRDRAGSNLENAEILVLYGILDNKDEAKIIEFRLRFGE